MTDKENWPENNSKKNLDKNNISELIQHSSEKLSKEIYSKFKRLEEKIVSEHQTQKENGIGKKEFTDFLEKNQSFWDQFISENRWTVSFENLRTKSKILISAIIVLAAISGNISGIFFQEIYTIYDPTKGWKNYIWNIHGKNIKKCKQEARNRQTALDCNVIEK